MARRAMEIMGELVAVMGDMSVEVLLDPPEQAAVVVVTDEEEEAIRKSWWEEHPVPSKLQSVVQGMAMMAMSQVAGHSRI
jgi:hypothetical protein